MPNLPTQGGAGARVSVSVCVAVAVSSGGGGGVLSSHTGLRAKAWCLLTIHAEASLLLYSYLSLLPSHIPVSSSEARDSHSSRVPPPLQQGVANRTQSRLRLTPSVPNLVGSAWHKVKQSVVGGFRTDFTFRIILDEDQAVPGRGLHSSTSRRNLSRV